MSDKMVVEKYRTLIQKFTDGPMDAEEFSRIYLQEFKNEMRNFSDETYHILQHMFVAADKYCKFPEIRDDDDLNEDDLLNEANETLKKLPEK